MVSQWWSVGSELMTTSPMTLGSVPPLQRSNTLRRNSMRGQSRRTVSGACPHYTASAVRRSVRTRSHGARISRLRWLVGECACQHRDDYTPDRRAWRVRVHGSAHSGICCSAARRCIIYPQRERDTDATLTRSTGTRSEDLSKRVTICSVAILKALNPTKSSMPEARASAPASGRTRRTARKCCSGGDAWSKTSSSQLVPKPRRDDLAVARRVGPRREEENRLTTSSPKKRSTA